MGSNMEKGLKMGTFTTNVEWRFYFKHRHNAEYVLVGPWGSAQTP